MKLGFFSAISLVAALTGCDSALGKITAMFSTKPVTAVIGAGLVIAVDGKPATVFGRDKCPAADPSMQQLFGPTSHDGESGCLVIPPRATTVAARVAINGQITDETWRVQRTDAKPSQVILRRPDGSPVIAYDDYLRANPTAKDLRVPTLALNAPGCVANGPDGKPLHLPEISAGGRFVIEKGSTFTSECFKREVAAQ